MTIEFEFDFERLSSLGLTAALASRAVQMSNTAAVADVNVRLMRVTEVHRETLAVHDGNDPRSARLLPRLVRELADEGTSIAVGDWVLVALDPHGDAWVEHRVPPSTHIARRDGDGRRHPVVSNVDTALLVMGLDDDFNPRRLERYLALVHGEGVVPVVVLTKRDVIATTPEALAERLDALRGRIPPAVDVLAVGTAVQDTGEVREHDSRGKHTTTARSLHRLPGGACVIDTPGLRALRPDGDASVLVGAFADIATLAAECRFRDCRHEQEPGCAVREGVAPDHLRNYHKLLREMQRGTLTPLERQREVAKWKAHGRVAEVRMKAKRGE